MSANDFKALLTLFLSAAALYSFGFFCLMRPDKVRRAFSGQMDFFHKKGLVLSYKKKQDIMSHPWYLVYLRGMGIVVILLASLVVFLFVFKLKEMRH